MGKEQMPVAVPLIVGLTGATATCTVTGTLYFVPAHPLAHGVTLYVSVAVRAVVLVTASLMVFPHPLAQVVAPLTPVTTAGVQVNDVPETDPCISVMPTGEPLQ